MQTKYVKLLQKLKLVPWMMLLLAVTLSLMPNCSSVRSYETSLSQEAVCDVLRDALPTYSSSDTEQTKREALVFMDVFDTVC